MHTCASTTPKQLGFLAIYQAAQPLFNNSGVNPSLVYVMQTERHDFQTNDTFSYVDQSRRARGSGPLSNNLVDQALDPMLRRKIERVDLDKGDMLESKEDLRRK